MIGRLLMGMAMCAALVAASKASAQAIVTPEADRRGTEQTYLTYPEWFLVFSPAEYADYLRRQPPSGFPFLGHVRQFWQSYGHVDRATREKYPPNAEYHTMIKVIGVSTTIEYGLRTIYERLIGRLTELTTDYPRTAEDKLAADVAQEYVDFIRLKPWYEFDFASRLKRVWAADWWGDDLLRKWERKYALTTEYAAKGLYGWLLGMASRATYGVSKETTLVVVDRVPEGIEIELPQLQRIATQADGSVLVSLPRYEPFTLYAKTLAAHGARFVEIAGNRDVILVTAWTPSGWQPPVDFGEPLFVERILTLPQFQRVALQVPVPALDRALATLSVEPFKLEHVFDY